MIDFNKFGRLDGKLTVHKQVEHTKFVHDIQPIGGQKQPYLKGHHTTSAHATCPCCHSEVETPLHLMQCRLNKQRKQALASTFTKAGKNGTVILSVVYSLILWDNG
jgi:hypothetical protein